MKLNNLIISFLVFSSTLVFSQTFVYECKDKKHFIIELKNEKAWLFTKDISMQLLHVESASGMKYQKGDIVFFSKGYEAMLDTPKHKYRNCTNNRYKAIWEDAKLRGNDFRATGNEPGWYLEIANDGKKTLLVMDYGTERYELKFPKRFVSKDNRTVIYKIKDFAEILIEGKTCTDSMTGKKFESRVELKISGKTYKGCGKALH
jgi:membrane-bound inhibitor of C-type lysozyme